MNKFFKIVTDSLLVIMFLSLLVLPFSSFTLTTYRTTGNTEVLGETVERGSDNVTQDNDDSNLFDFFSRQEEENIKTFKMRDVATQESTQSTQSLDTSN